jgi:hypothetical protein
MRVASRWIALAAVFSALMVIPGIVLAIINNTFVDYSKMLITVEGSGFGDKPGTVVIGTTTPLTVSSWSASTIVAKLPSNVVAGSYLLTITSSEGSRQEFDFTTGAEGPQGPAGAGLDYSKAHSELSFPIHPSDAIPNQNCQAQSDHSGTGNVEIVLKQTGLKCTTFGCWVQYDGERANDGYICACTWVFPLVGTLPPEVHKRECRSYLVPVPSNPN